MGWIPELTKKYAFVWRPKNVALTGHGSMARLDRVVRTLRMYMDRIKWFGTKLMTWEMLIAKAVQIFNKSEHSFSAMPPKELVKHPEEMHWTRLRDYGRGWPYYSSIMPYLKPGEFYYTRVDRDNPDRRYRYGAFEKGADRQVWSTTPRRISYVYGNKFFLEGDDPHNTNDLYSADSCYL